MRAEDWIPIEQRVPEDRRKVAVWIDVRLAPSWLRRKGDGFLSQSRYNPSPRGGRFDADTSGRWASHRVTHWQEVVGPDDACTIPPDESWQPISEADLVRLELWLAEGRERSAFIPADAAVLANATAHMIREVRAARAASAARPGDA